jgi:HDOD domain
LRDNKPAGLPEIIVLVQTITEKAQEISIQDLASVVEKDTAILAKILSLANAFGYNPTRLPIKSVAHAIQVIGFERIRTLAVSLLLFEQARETQATDERRVVAACALFSGSFAKAAAERGMYTEEDEAFMCASLRHYGRIVLSTFLVEVYRNALELLPGFGEDEAFKSTFGLTSIDLGYELLRLEHLPSAILGALKPFSPEKATATDNPSIRRLALADFSTQISLLVFNDSLSHGEFNKRLKLLAKLFEKLLPGIGANLTDLLASAESYLIRFNEGLGSGIIPSRLLQEITQRVAQAEPDRSVDEYRAVNAGLKAMIVPPEGKAPVQGDVTPAAVEKTPMQKRLEELETVVGQSGTSELALSVMVISILALVFDAPECILFYVTGGRDSDLRIAHGQGNAWQSLKSKAVIRRSERSTLGLCLQRRENILIHDSSETLIAQLTPAWLKGYTDLRSYILVPLVDRDGNQALMLVGWLEKRHIEVTVECVETIHELNRILPIKTKRKPGG